MTKTTNVVVSDDLDGSPNASTVSFSFEGKAFEIDLAKKNAVALEKLLKPYVNAARRAPGRSVRPTGRKKAAVAAPRRAKTAAGGSDLAAIRAWAAEAGIPVATRGRISADVKEQYAAAH